SITTRSLLDFFKGTQFRDQFFIIDACRDVPWSSEMQLGVMPRPRKHDPTQPAVQQFVFYATSPGMKAVDERGTLTETMVAGLKGAGRAKSWDADGERYVVTVDRLFEYVKAEFEAHQRSVGRGDNHELYQVPRKGGESGSAGLDSNPTLVQFRAEE